MLKTYTERVNYLHQTKKKEEAIAKTEASLARYTYPPALWLTEVVEALVTKSLRCGELFDECVLNVSFSKRFKIPSVTVSDRTGVRS